jgi:hypothetical protein
MGIMKIIKLQCSNCGIEFQKEVREYKRQIKNGRVNFYCTLSCSKKITENIFMITKSAKPFHFVGGENKITTIEGKVFQAMKEFSRRIRRRKKFDKEVSPTDLMEIWNNQSGKCTYTNVQLILPCSSEYNTSNNNFKASIDRIDSKKPYSIDNIQFTSVTVNYLKNNMIESDIAEFFNIIKS